MHLRAKDRIALHALVALTSSLCVDGCGGASPLDDIGGGSSADGGSSTTSPPNNGGPEAGAPNGSLGDGGAVSPSSCPYTDDASFCACMRWNCGGATVTSKKDAAGNFVTVYCGSCAGTPGTWCQPNNPDFTGAGKCGGNNPLVYPYQRGLINMLEAMGENDTTDYASQYSYIQNIRDGRGYTIGTVGFCTGTGDFIVVARCLNNLVPNNPLAKYWPGLVAIDNAFYTKNANNGDTGPVDALGPFVKDVELEGANDPIYRGCQDTMGDADYMDTALQHAEERGLKGALTIGFLYDTELNFGDDDDPNGVAGAKTVMKKADADYGPGLPTDFTGKPWEESRWLGYLIKERTTVMATDPSGTWQQDMDQNATWEAARRLHTGASTDPESATDLDMDYAIVSAYKSGAGAAPCWPSLPDKTDSSTSISAIAPDKNGADPAKWKAIDTGNAPDDYEACPPNPTP